MTILDMSVTIFGHQDVLVNMVLLQVVSDQYGRIQYVSFSRSIGDRVKVRSIFETLFIIISSFLKVINHLDNVPGDSESSHLDWLYSHFIRLFCNASVVIPHVPNV